jgi:hypothetical protein
VSAPSSAARKETGRIDGLDLPVMWQRGLAVSTHGGQAFAESKLADARHASRRCFDLRAR